MGCITCRTVCTTGNISFFHVHQEESAADRQSDERSVPGDTAECCSVRSVFSVALHVAKRTPLIPGVNTNCHSPPTLSSSSYGLLGYYAVSAELHGVTLKDRNLSADHLEQFHTHSFDQHQHRQNHVVPSELPAPL